MDFGVQQSAKQTLTALLRLPSPIPSITYTPPPSETHALSCLTGSMTGPSYVHSACPDPPRGSKRCHFHRKAKPPNWLLPKIYSDRCQERRLQDRTGTPSLPSLRTW